MKPFFKMVNKCVFFLIIYASHRISVRMHTSSICNHLRQNNHNPLISMVSIGVNKGIIKFKESYPILKSSILSASITPIRLQRAPRLKELCLIQKGQNKNYLKSTANGERKIFPLQHLLYIYQTQKHIYLENYAPF